MFDRNICATAFVRLADMAARHFPPERLAFGRNRRAGGFARLSFSLRRQGVAVARAAAFGGRVIIMDEPTAALGVKESRNVLDLISDVRARGLPIVLVSHNMPHVFEVCDRIHIHRLGRRLCVIDPDAHSMSDAVAFMTGAAAPPA